MKKTVKKLPMELYDKVNYMCRCYMDRIARFRLDYDLVPDVEALKKAIVYLYDAAPIFHSRVIENPVRPYWSVCDYTVDDSLTVENTADMNKSADEFLTKGIELDDNTQMKIGLFIEGEKCALCFRWNHMIMDGGGFKQFAEDLFRAYNLITSGVTPSDFRIGSRHYKEVYRDLSEATRKKAMTKLSNKTSGEKKHLPFTAENQADKNIIVVKNIDERIFSAAMKNAKKSGATVNDLIAAAYIEAAYKLIGCEKESMTLSSAVDLRRYIKNPDRLGYTNHTTFMPCTLEKKGKTVLDTLKAVAQSTKKSKEDEFLGLYGLPLLNYAFTAMIHIQAEFMVRLFYNNANLAVSNVGAVDTKAYSLGSHAPTYAMVAGGAKRKPCAAVTALTIGGRLVVSMSIKGNDEDRKMVEKFFSLMEESINEIAKIE
ncbi:MAG: hypothetical protein IJ491_02095 [Clostridia bacterium]|nr:hypothetical protein [Clostridia bacterium]